MKFKSFLIKSLPLILFFCCFLVAQNTNVLVQSKESTTKSLEFLEKRYLYVSTNRDYENHKKIFKYGTYDKQLVTLESVKKHLEQLALSSNDVADVNLKEGYGKVYTKLIESYLENFPNDSFKVFLIEWIGFFDLKEYVGLIEELLRSPTRKQRGIGVIVKQKSLDTLRELISFENERYQDLYFQFFQDREKHGGHREIRLAALKGLKKILPQQYRFELKNAFLKERNRDLKNALLETITAYQEEEDIKFVHEAIKKERTPFLKSSYVTLLTNYSKFPQAEDIVLDFYRDKNVRVSVAALSALGSFSLDYDFYLEAGKKNLIESRLKVVEELGKDKYQQKEVNDFLVYLSKNDKEAKIRERAKKILEKRGLIPDEDEKKDFESNQDIKEEDTQLGYSTNQ